MTLLTHDLNPERLFLNSIKSEATRTAYVIFLKKCLEFYKLRNLSDLLYTTDHKQIESQIINFIITMKEQGKSLQAIKNYISPLVSFYRINDVMINSKKIQVYASTRPNKK
jgi:hypothetical protein